MSSDEDFQRLKNLNSQARNMIAQQPSQPQEFHQQQEGQFFSMSKQNSDARNFGQIQLQPRPSQILLLSQKQPSQRRYETRQPQPQQPQPTKKIQIPKVTLEGLNRKSTDNKPMLFSQTSFMPQKTVVERLQRKIKQQKNQNTQKANSVRSRRFLVEQSQSQEDGKQRNRKVRIRSDWNIQSKPQQNAGIPQRQNDNNQKRKPPKLPKYPPSNPSSGDELDGMKGIEYKGGDFSKFAFQQETQNIKIKEYISKVINQAVQSHVRQIQKVMEIQTELQKKSDLYKRKLEVGFKDPQNLLKFLRDPIGATLDEIEYIKPIIKRQQDQYFTKTVNDFVSKLLVLKNYALVENRLLSLKDYKLSQYFHDEEKNMYIPSKTYDNYFLKISPNKQAVHTILNKNKMFTREELAELNTSQKQTIISMVFKYLINQGIAIEIDDIRHHIDQRIRSLKIRQ